MNKSKNYKKMMVGKPTIISSASSGRHQQACSKRNLGGNTALALKTGGGTHMTLVYIENVKRGFEQARVKQLVEDFFNEHKVPDNVDLELTEDMWTERCVAVGSDELQLLQQALFTFLTAEHKLSVRALRPLHIDLRGQPGSVVLQSVATRDNWLY